MASSSSSSPEILGAHSEGHFSYKNATHDEVLEDLSSRFILNLPDDELSSLERICFQVEQAHWFYEDFVREENPKFPSLHLKKFSAMLFNACPLLHQWRHDHEQAFNTFMQYKTRVPVCGAIMLNETWEKCLLVKGWKSSSGWGFPKGKINEVEPPVNCAIREVLEETGYNLAGKINPDDVIELSIKEQKISLYIVPGVPEDYPFKTKTRKEISKIEWFKLTELPTWKRSKTPAGRFYLISPFIVPLKAFINERKPRSALWKSSIAKKQLPQSRKHVTLELQQDVRQESSSQSSSAENGEPQTPSPSYTEAHPDSVPRIANSDLTQAEVPMDPHFAQLLSALAISASGSKRDESVKSPCTGALAKPQPLDAPSVQHKISLNPATGTGVTRTPLSPAVPSIPSPRPSPGLQYLPDAIDANSQRYIDSSPTSSRLQGPSRNTNVHDISPYLFRPSTTIIPSANRLKHIALLEAASAESARLMQAYKTAAAQGLPVDVKDNFKHAITVNLAGTTEPQADIQPYPNALTFNAASHHLEESILHTSRPLDPPSSPLFSHTYPSPWSNGIFPGRSKTSMAYHSGNLMDLHPSASPHMGPTSQMSTLMNSACVPQNGLHPYTLSQQGGSIYSPAIIPPTNLSTATASPVKFSSPYRTLPTSSPSVSALPQQPPSNTLLSILNTRAPSRTANVPSFSSIPSGPFT